MRAPRPLPPILFEIAEKAVTENIDALERLSDRDPERANAPETDNALKDLQEGVEATRRMLLERCKMREGVSV
jgi:hypothetical protein